MAAAQGGTYAAHDAGGAPVKRRWFIGNWSDCGHALWRIYPMGYAEYVIDCSVPKLTGTGQAGRARPPLTAREAAVWVLLRGWERP